MGIKKEVIRRLITLFSNHYMPKWVIFMIDLLLVTASFFISTFIWQSITLDFNTNPTYQYLVVIYVGVFLILSLIFRTYSGVIRHSSNTDLVRLLLMSIFSGLILFFIDLKINLIQSNFPYNNKALIVYWITWSFLFLFVFRKMVRFSYLFWQQIKVTQKRTIVLLGGDHNLDHLDYLVSNSLSNYQPVVFLDKTGKLEGKRISNIPIVGYKENIKDISEKYRAETLLLLKSDLPKLNGLSEDCLSNNIDMIVSEANTFDGKINLSSNVHRIQIDDLLNREVIKREKDHIDQLESYKCLMVTGGAGSIGSEIVRQLCQFKGKLIIFDSAESPLHNIRLEIEEQYPEKDILSIIGDVRNLEKLEAVFGEYHPDIVFHAAAYKHVPLMEEYPEEAILANVLGSKNVADLCVKYGAQKMVMISTDKAVNPTNVMGASKRIAEQYINALFQQCRLEGKNVKMVTTRFGNVLGSNGSVVPIFKKQIEKGGPITITHKDIIRYFMTIPEACSLVLEAACMCKGGEIFVFDMGKPVKIYDLAIKMIKLAGLKPLADINIVETGLRPGEKLYEELLTNKEENLPTYNEKIMIAKVDVLPYNSVNLLVDNLIQEAKLGNRFNVVKVMKKIVPEYKSNNSIYEILDQHDIVVNTKIESINLNVNSK